MNINIIRMPSKIEAQKAADASEKVWGLTLS